MRTQAKLPAFVLLWAYPAQIAIDNAYLNTPDHSIGHYAASALMIGLVAAWAWAWAYSTTTPANP